MPTHDYANEFPLLTNLGLYAARTIGDGNCLFNALSDQLYGTQDYHFDIRSAVIDHLRLHKDDMKQFMAVGSGGSTRRNPRRKAASFDDQGLPSAKDIDRAFDQHLDRMAKGGTWGDNMEIVAFSKVYKVTVRVYRQDIAMMFYGGAPDANILHIAYHEWEHYSSIRNIDGPHTGKPHVKPYILSPEEEAQQAARMQPSTVPINESCVKELDASTGGLLSRDVLVEALQQSGGDVYLAYELLNNESSQPSQQDTASRSSVPPSSRANDSSSDGSRGPMKRQDRRLSRKTKTKQRHQQIQAGLSRYPDDSLESLQSSILQLSSPQKPGTIVLRDIEYDPNASDTEFEDWKPHALPDGDTSSGSEYSGTGQKITLRLHSKSSSGTPPKRLGSAREPKSLKKQAQRQAARGKRGQNKQSRQASPTPSAMSTSQASTISSHPGNVRGGIRTLSV